MSSIRRRSCHVATYLVAIQLPGLYPPLAAEFINPLLSRVCQWLFELPHFAMDGGGWVKVLGGAAVSGDTVSLVVPATKLFFAKAVEAARGTPCAGDVTATGGCGVSLLAGHLKVLLLSLLCSSRCGKPGAV